MLNTCDCAIQVGDPIQVLNLESKQLETGRITKLYVTKGVAKSEVASATAGAWFSLRYASLETIC